MHISVFDLFKIGIGPSSSHTVGPMNAARCFAMSLRETPLWGRVNGVKVELFGSLGFTGKGHRSDRAVMLGLSGDEPRTVDLDTASERVERMTSSGALALLGERVVSFKPAEAIIFHRKEKLPLHSNGMRLSAYQGEALLLQRIYYSVGGGFLVDEQGVPISLGASQTVSLVPFAFSSGAELLSQCNSNGLSVSTLMLENEKSQRPEQDIRDGLLEISQAMDACIKRGCEKEGILPGGLGVKRRAASLCRRLKAEARGAADPLVIIDWVNLWALAVNEENAAGGRVVTAPTNGAAGIIPAVLRYYRTFIPNADDDGTQRFLLTAAAIGALYKKNASISGAEVGCQGEVGVACSMAAGALAEVMGGTPEQVENAAEIGMEHNLGLTCDPIGGLVQVPCIERNAMGSVKAINAARLSLSGDGKHKVSLDRVIATMVSTGADMSAKYKETAQGGLAVNIVEC